MLVYGRNVAKDILKKGEKVEKIFLQENFNDKEIISLIENSKIVVFYKKKREIDNLCSGVHQGILLFIPDYQYSNINTFLNKNEEKVVILDHIEDPHNLGAIIRTCEAAGIKSVIIPKDRQVQVNATVMKTSVGTLDNVNIINIISIMLVGISTALILRGNNLFNSAGQRLIKLNNRYNNKNIRLILGAITSVAICITPYFDGGYLTSNLIILTLVLIVEPVFEEVIFREYVWNYIGSFQKDEKKVLIIVTLLSALFKIGYWDMVSQSLSVIGSSFFTIDIIIQRVFVGLIVSLILGLVKIKYKDTYLCIFVHSLINIFLGR